MRDRIEAIEGLRGIAVLAVLAFHLGIPGFEWGYLGVDLFFAVSGFVITRMLTDRSITYADFLKRRARRLLPSYIVTIGLTLVGGFAVLSAANLSELGSSAVASLLGVPNLFFWQQSGYFEAAAALKPLLHLWSLGVEFQFYLVWPFVVWAVLRLPSHWRLIILLGVALLSFGVAWIASTYAPSATFYLTPFRVYEFAFGATLVFLPRLPIGLLAAVLSLRPLTWVGSISYSLYLVHWPLIVLYNYALWTPPQWTDRVVQAVACMALAVALQRLVETPFRQRSLSLRWIGASSVVAAAAFGLILSNGALLRMPPALQATGYDTCAYPLCFIPVKTSTPYLIIFGDSHARSFSAGLVEFSQATGAQIAIFHFDGRCRFINPPEENDIVDYDCEARLQEALNFARASGASHLLFAHRWTQENVASMTSHLLETLQRPELAAFSSVGVVLNVPEFPNGWSKDVCTPPEWIPPRCADVDRHSGAYDHVQKVNDELRVRLRGLTIFDPFPAFCDEERCRLKLDDSWLYSDAHHVSAAGSRLAVKMMSGQLAQWLNLPSQR